MIDWSSSDYVSYNNIFYTPETEEGLYLTDSYDVNDHLDQTCTNKNKSPLYDERSKIIAYNMASAPPITSSLQLQLPPGSIPPIQTSSFNTSIDKEKSSFNISPQPENSYFTPSSNFEKSYFNTNPENTCPKKSLIMNQQENSNPSEYIYPNVGLEWPYYNMSRFSNNSINPDNFFIFLFFIIIFFFIYVEIRIMNIKNNIYRTNITN
jgi:hypothetical protein